LSAATDFDLGLAASSLANAEINKLRAKRTSCFVSLATTVFVAALGQL
jgi:hypothetical protein